MPAGGLRRFDVQATYALILAVVSAVPAVAAVLLAYSRYDSAIGRIVYGSGGRFLPAFVICVLAALGLGGAAFVLGFYSAGQRRNDKPARSWIAFFLGGSACTLSVILLIAFYLLRQQLPSG